MINGRVALLVTALSLVGCGSRPAIPVANDQTLVMEANVLAAGITADSPTLSTQEIQPLPRLACSMNARSR
jgi:uncharacterized protein YcfL